MRHVSGVFSIYCGRSAPSDKRFRCGRGFTAGVQWPNAVELWSRAVFDTQCDDLLHVSSPSSSSVFACPRSAPERLRSLFLVTNFNSTESSSQRPFRGEPSSPSPTNPGLSSVPSQRHIYLCTCIIRRDYRFRAGRTLILTHRRHRCPVYPSTPAPVHLADRFGHVACNAPPSRGSSSRDVTPFRFRSGGVLCLKRYGPALFLPSLTHRTANNPLGTNYDETNGRGG